MEGTPESGGAGSMDAITALMAERDRFEHWIQALEARRASTPEHVFDRVRGDYEHRLMGVLGQLAGRASELEGTVTDLDARVREALAREQARQDERAEAELRAAVGEFEPEHWDRVRSDLDGEIGRLAAERMSLSGDLTRMRDILRVATAPRRTAIDDPGAEPAAPADEYVAASAAGPQAAPASAEPEPMTVPAFSPDTFVDDASPGGGSGVGYTEELPMITDLAEAEAEPAATSAAEPVGDPAPAPRPNPFSTRPTPRNVTTASGPRFDELEFLKSVTTGARGDTPAPPAAPPAADVARQGTGGGRRFATPLVTPAIRRDDEGQSRSTSSFFKDVPQEQSKTLRCSECGTMNFPTEWYCERCGGELAAM